MSTSPSSDNPTIDKALHRRLLIYFFKFQFRPKYFWFRLTVMLCAIVSTIAWDIAVPYQFKSLIDQITPLIPPLEESAWRNVLEIFVFIIGFYVIGLVAEVLLTNMVYLSTPLIMRDMENECFEKLQEFPYDFYANSFVGSLVAQLRRFGDAYLNLEVEFTENMLRLLIRVLAVGIAICVFSPSILLPAMIWAIVFVIAVSFLIHKKMLHDRNYSVLDSKVTATLADSVTNFLTIKIFGREKEELERFKSVNHQKTRSMQYGWAWSSGIFMTQHTLNVAINIIVLFYALSLWSEGQITIGTIVFLQMLLATISKALVDLGNSMKVIYRSLARAEEMYVLLEQEPTLHDPKCPKKPKISKGKIDFRNVRFSYNDDDQEVFSELDIQIKPGERVGLVGPSGSGKSTFVKLLLRFMDPQSGHIEIDGQRIDKIRQADLRRHISFVPQEPTLFHRSIWDNISYGEPDADERAIRKVVKNSYLTEMIDKLPEGLNTLVGERGIKLSGGEKQRVAIARAMLKKAPILVLDEATSSLDSTSEVYIQNAFQNLMKGRTTIVIAHRLSTIARLDRIIVLKEGHIVEDGTHSQLLKKKGLYASLYNNQKDGMIGDGEDE